MKDNCFFHKINFFLSPLPKAVRLLVVAVYTTIYSFIQPYRSRLANHFEIAVNLNFLLLLTISSTSFFTDDFFFFPSFADVTESTGGESYCGSVEGVAVVSWVLMPFYYLPVLVAVVTVAVLVALHVRCVCLEGGQISFVLSQTIISHNIKLHFFGNNFNEIG